MQQSFPVKVSLSNMTKLQLDQLGMEARSILKSIRTEHAKLDQSKAVATQDLHYFRARYNYYRLSLMRLTSEERKLLEPFLSEFRASIVKREAFAGNEAEAPEAQVTPFLAPVDEKVEPEPTPEPEAVDSVAHDQPDQEEREVPVSEDLKASLRSELSLVKLALGAKASAESNEIISQAVDRMLKKLN